MYKGNFVCPFVAIASILPVPLSIINLITLSEVFCINLAVSHIHNCLLFVLLTPNIKPIPYPFVFVPSKYSIPVNEILGCNWVVPYTNNLLVIFVAVPIPTFPVDNIVILSTLSGINLIIFDVPTSFPISILVEVPDIKYLLVEPYVKYILGLPVSYISKSAEGLLVPIPIFPDVWIIILGGTSVPLCEFRIIEPDECSIKKVLT